ncbi:hypothetical protein FHEFKHOI_00352 [Candidatus Methanoperedenaceae archaeon GB50]|nr:hypothetical protein FHEFKHOI_00352 [Candidatus Methanoperedenaceae archaeon GB50]CAD7779105.1 MAG: hypothetical protein KBONHNOK_01248 [Candidatus Methanoperedenaceae archaeon GB50]
MKKLSLLCTAYSFSLLKDEGISDEFAGYGTRYSLTVTKHYRNTPKKKGKDFRYVFRVQIGEGCFQ